jgi:hypothetical protein
MKAMGNAMGTATRTESASTDFGKRFSDRKREEQLKASAGHEQRIDERQHPLPDVKDILLASQLRPR